MGLVQKLFFGTPLGWYTNGDISVENRDAVIRWLEDRSRFSTWLTSIVSGACVLLVSLGPPLQSFSTLGIIRLIGLSLMLLSILTNIISIWSISNYKLNIALRKVKDAPRLRLDIELVNLFSVGAFFVGFSFTIIATIF